MGLTKEQLYKAIAVHFLKTLHAQFNSTVWVMTEAAIHDDIEVEVDGDVIHVTLPNQFACALCGNEQDDIGKCLSCGSDRVVNRSTLEQHLGKDWKTSIKAV